MGEETDGVVESVSKMQEKIKALTGVDILTDTGAYKETYTILSEIGQVWEDMSDIDQAALLELMAGKNRANTLAAILGNMEDLEGAYKSALNAEGSALRENQAYLDSIQGRIDLFTNSLQTMWMNAVDSDIVKFIVDLGTAAVNLVDTLGLIPTLLAGFAGFSAIKSIFSSGFMQGIVEVIGNVVKSGEILDATIQKSVVTYAGVSVQARLASSSLVQYAVSQNLVQKEQLETMTTTQLLGVGFTGLVAKIKAATIAMAKFLFTTPLGWSIVAITAITGVIAAYNAWGPTHDNFVEKLNEETDSLKTVQSELQSVQSELETTKDRIEELEAKGSLSFVEEEELNRLRQQTAELERQEEILLAQEKRAKNKQIDAALNAAKTDSNLSDNVITIGSSYAAVASAQQNTYTTGIPYAAGLQYSNSQNETKSENLGNVWEINLNNLKAAKEDLDAANKELSETTYDVESTQYKELEKKVKDAQARVDKYNGTIDSMNKTWQSEYGEVGYVENATTESEKAWNEFYRQHQDYLTQQAFINGTFNKADVLNSTFGVYATDAAKEFKEKFESGVKDGKNPVEVIDSLLSDANYSSAFAGLADQFGITLDDIKNYFTQVGEFATPEVVESITAIGQAYSTLSASVEKYTSINDVLNESIYDNVEISKEQYDALNELIGSEEEFADCIDTSNGYVVKNTALLRKLVNQKKKEQKATIQEAKAYSQLQYKTTVGQIRQLIQSMEAEIKATGFVSSATLENIDILQEQLGAIRQTIQQYALLELSLSDAANAYNEFEAAKQRDAELTYGDSMVEMLQVINDGFKTGQVGSEAFQAAVKALVPESVYKDIDDVQERMQAIHDYIDKDSVFADYFTIDDSGISVTMDNIKAFLQDGLDDGLGENFGVFTGTIEDFDLAPHIQSIEDLASAYGITEAAALAMLTEFEKYDASWGDIIAELTTTPLDRKINEATDSLEEALTAQEEFIKSGQPLYENGEMTEGYKAVTDAVNNAQKALDDASQAAIDNAQTYTQVEAMLKGMTGEVKYTQEQADALGRSLGLIDENGHIKIDTDTGALILTQEQIETLNEKLTGLEKPTILDIQLAYDDIDRQLKELQSYIDDPRNYKGTILTELNIANEAEANAKIAELTADRDAIQLVYNITTTSTEQANGNMEQLAVWETNGINIIITGDATSFDETVAGVNEVEMESKEVPIDTVGEEEAHKKIDSVDSHDIDDKTPAIKMEGVSTALADIRSIDRALDNLSGTRLVTISVTSKEAQADGNFHISGGAFASGTIGAPKNEEALVGELGPELLVRNGRWTTVGNNGAEFTQVRKGDIIFNHKQTEQLLKNGYVTGRGKAYAGGTAYGFGIFDAYVGDNDAFKNGSDEWVDPWENADKSLNNAADAISDAADDISDATDEFKEVFDWIEVRIEELDETLNLLNAQLENVAYYNEKNNIIDNIIDVNNAKLENLKAGYQEYSNYAEKLLSEIPKKYRDAAKNGAIAIEQFVGEADETTLEAINNYREWAQKAADFKQQANEIITAIRDLAIQKFDNAYEAGDVRATVEDSQTEKLQNQVDLLEEMGEIASSVYYGINGGDAATSTGMFENSYKKIEYLTKAREAMQKELNNAVETGQIKRGSNEWYELIDQMYQIDAQIHEATAELEEFQNAINDIHWENFDQLINRIDYLKDETQSLIDLMDSSDMIADPSKRTYKNGTVEYWTANDVNWTDEGLASLGLYAQQMEIAEYESKQYAEAIDDLTKEYKAGHYSENEYIEKLKELKDAQYDSIEAYYDAQDAIKDLNKTRIDSIKNGIEKEIEAFEELIEKRKEALDVEKDMHDFQKSVMEQQKSISDIERKLAAIANDNSISATAKRKQLEAELAEAQYELEETYYDRSVEDKQNALDKELEKFQEEKDAEITKWEEYLENVELVVADSLNVIQANASGIYDTLNSKAQEYDLTLSDAILSPWQDGSLAVSDYQETFDTAMSSTMNHLESLKTKWQEVIDKMVEASKIDVSNINKENERYAAAKEKESAKTNNNNNNNSNKDQNSSSGLSEKDYYGVALAIINGNYGWGGGKDRTNRLKSKGFDPNKMQKIVDQLYVDKSVNNGTWKGKFHGISDLAPFHYNKYASGTLGTKKDELALIDELGDELVMHAGKNGRLTFLTKGSSVIPHDISENLMQLGNLDPRDVLDRSRPVINAPHITNNNIELNMEIAEVVHIDTVTNETIPNLTKAIEKQMDKYMKNINAEIRKYSR